MSVGQWKVFTLTRDKQWISRMQGAGKWVHPDQQLEVERYSIVKSVNYLRDERVHQSQENYRDHTGGGETDDWPPEAWRTSSEWIKKKRESADHIKDKDGF
ncbi:hypothetical protein RRG08_038073 [Elysia crispata]|uniref:Uncharacterized protein n=1 Tax=Elysia crispata TaxID=231223 RepID=A0AAE1DP79_9GAST|nr:hypothetical protein RRG08_038073 [Elysia crispata]